MRIAAPLFGLALAALPAASPARASPAKAPVYPASGSSHESLREVATFDNVPVGVAVSKEDRIFLAFSRAIDKDEPWSVAELKDNKPVPFPQGFRQDKGAPADDRLLSVQALAIDARNRLWILDSAKVGQQPIQPGTAKLVAVDLKTNRAVKTIRFPAEVTGPEAFVNDLVIDLGKGAEGTIFLTDASFEGKNGLIVVDIASGKSYRRLDGHPSTKAAPGFIAKVDGAPLVMKGGKMPGKPLAAGADGIALDVDLAHLYYSALSGHRFYRVSTEALADPAQTPEQVAATVEDLGDKGFASDGLAGDAQGNLWATDYEENAIRRRDKDGSWSVEVKDPRLSWPDSMALGSDGTLYFTCTQISRSELVRGKDERVKPFTLWSIKTTSSALLPAAGKRPPAKSQARTPPAPR